MIEKSLSPAAYADLRTRIGNTNTSETNCPDCEALWDDCLCEDMNPPSPAIGLTMADTICQLLFGPSTVKETAHSIMRDAKQMTSVSPAPDAEIH